MTEETTGLAEDPSFKDFWAYFGKHTLEIGRVLTFETLPGTYEVVEIDGDRARVRLVTEEKESGA